MLTTRVGLMEMRKKTSISFSALVGGGVFLPMLSCHCHPLIQSFFCTPARALEWKYMRSLLVSSRYLARLGNDGHFYSH